MIIAKKMLVICALSSAGFLGAMELYNYKNSAVAEEKAFEEKVKVAVIDTQINELQKEQSRLNEKLEKRFSNSTLTYRAAKKASFSESNAKIEKLKKEKAQLQAKAKI